MLANSATTCPSDAEINDFCAGRLPNHRFQHLLEHLDQCADCQHRTDSDLSPDSFVSALAAVGDPAADDPLFAEPDCQAALFHAVEPSRRSWDAVLPPVETLGPYRLIRPLGRGGMGAVYLAEHERLKKKYAIKLLPRERGFNADWVERFDREMRAVASLSHPGIVTATDAGEANGWHYLVMEFLDGLDLAAVVRRIDVLSVEDAVLLAVEMCHALATVHDAGLVHRDVKPSNVMLTREGTVKLLDLGLVLDNQNVSGDFRLTTVGHILGTLAFAAPEQLSEGNVISVATDLYGVGATLFQLLAGRPAHATDRGLAPLVVAKTTQDAPSLTKYRSEVPPELSDLVDRLLQRTPQQRPADARAVAAELEAMLTTTAKTNPKQALRALVRRALRSDDPEPSVTSSSSHTIAVKPSGGDRRRGKLVAVFLAGFAAACLAGILLFLQTNRGTLIVESDLDDVQLTVSKNGKPVDNFEVQTGPNQTTLRTGNYQVQVQGAAEGVQVSPQQVLIQRGEETMLKVQRVADLKLAQAAVGPPDAHDQPDHNVKTFRGYPVDYWMDSIRTERDLETLGEAMDAISVLADGDDVAAAQSILIAARDYGGWTVDNPVGSDRSAGFMYYFDRTFGRMMPQPGVAAICDELSTDDAHSRAASLWACRNLEQTAWMYWAAHPENTAVVAALRDQVQHLLNDPTNTGSPPEPSFEGLNQEALLYVGCLLTLADNDGNVSMPAVKKTLQDKLHGIEREYAVSPHSQDLEVQWEAVVGRTYGGLPSLTALTALETLAAVRLGIDVPTPLEVDALVRVEKGNWHAAEDRLSVRMNAAPAEVADELWLALIRQRKAWLGEMIPSPRSFWFEGKLLPENATGKPDQRRHLLVAAAANTTRPDLAGLVLEQLAAHHSTVFLGGGNTNQKQQYAALAEAWRVAKQRAEQMQVTDPAQPPNQYFGDKNPFDSLPLQPSDRGGMF